MRSGLFRQMSPWEGAMISTGTSDSFSMALSTGLLNLATMLT